MIKIITNYALIHKYISNITISCGILRKSNFPLNFHIATYLLQHTSSSCILLSVIEILNVVRMKYVFFKVLLHF